MDQENFFDADIFNVDMNAKILNIIDELIIYMDKDFNIKWSNKTAQEYFSSSREELIDKKCYDKWGFSDFCFDCPVVKAKKTKNIEKTEMAKPNGHYWLMKAIPDLSENGEIKGIIEIARDITDRKLYEKELTRINNKLNREYDRAEMLHNNLLPSELPQTKELKIAAYYEPAYRLGGDFYDFLEIENQIIFYISDVSGHDLSSSMLNVFLKEAINSFIRAPECLGNTSKSKINIVDLTKFIKSTFENLGLPSDYFISLLVGVINVENNNIKICNAGIHCLPILLKSNEIINLENAGLPITSLEGINFDYKETVINLKPGETFFAYTDGLIEQEIENNNDTENRETFGEKRLIEVLEKNKDHSPAEIIEAVNCRLEKKKGDIEIQDDQTYIAIQHQ